MLILVIVISKLYYPTGINNKKIRRKIFVSLWLLVWCSDHGWTAGLSRQSVIELTVSQTRKTSLVRKGRRRVLSVFDQCAGLACLECSQTGLLQRVWMVRDPTMGIIKCQEFIGEKAVAVGWVWWLWGGLIISVTFLLPTDILWEHKPGRDRDIIDNWSERPDCAKLTSVKTSDQASIKTLQVYTPILSLALVKRFNIRLKPRLHWGHLGQQNCHSVGAGWATGDMRVWMEHLTSRPVNW